MKLSELRPCDACGGPHHGQFYVLRMSLAMVKPRAANQVLGLTQIFGGALGLAEVMAPEAEAVMILGDAEPALWSEYHLCNSCTLEQPINIALLMSRQEKER